ncbi:CocE/NonD family hydrolase [Mycobacterium sp. NPDC048908]|uniref:CocE/NonD family hydrolase n=1 Tax=Mycobacterium sp. NPDC048908 TaxID=3364292 RepID=UPI0037139F83
MTAVSVGASSPLISRVRQVAGRTLSKLLDLPPHTTEFHVIRDVRVPMRDGVELIADHYHPATANPSGTLLLRGPYGRGWPSSLLFAQMFAARGYHVVFQSVRGTFGSGGVFDPMVNETADGADTAAWLRDQPWFTGSFATIGMSYLGFTQWALLTDPPQGMAASVIIAGPHDLSGPRWGTGSFGLDDFLGWSDMVARQEEPRTIRTVVRQIRARHALTAATNALPLGESARRFLGAGAPWLEDWLDHPEYRDPHWAKLQLHQALERARIPVLLLSGWQDVFLEQSLAQYRRLRERDVPVALTVGPWNHGQMMTKGAGTLVRESLQWLDTHVAGIRTVARKPVRIHLNGHGWRVLDDWPPAMPEHALYLRPAGHLGAAAPDQDVPAASFTFDPSDPTPTIGGRLLASGGYLDDTRLAERADVLAFTSAPLPADLYVVGTPLMQLSHSCDNTNHDLFVRLSEVDARGRSRNVSDGYLSATTDSPDPRTIRMELDAIAHRFPAGARIRVLIAGGSHPRFVRNLGTGEPVLTGKRLATAKHTVHLGDGGTSRLVLPAGPRPPSGR